jgi:hypothetical protein
MLGQAVPKKAAPQRLILKNPVSGKANTVEVSTERASMSRRKLEAVNYCLSTY